MEKIRIIVDDIIVHAELFDTECAKAIVGALPIEARPREWGDEFYFEVPVRFPLDDTATSDVRVGDIGYWPPGHALAIFFGPTPMSSDSEPVPASDVNLVGKIYSGATLLRNAKGARTIRIEKAD